MPLLLSFDIGTRHLAYCAVERVDRLDVPPVIRHWRVVDLLAVPGTPYVASTVHTRVKDWTVGEMRAHLEAEGAPTDGTRAVLKARVLDGLAARGVPKVAPNNPCLLATQLYAHLDAHPWMLECDHIVLENQPCLTNPVMKSVQLLLFGYFMYRGVWTEYVRRTAAGEDTRVLPHVALVSASNKLKAEMTGLASVATPDATTDATDVPDATDAPPPQGSKAAYKARKHDAIALASQLLDDWCAADPAYEPWRALFAGSCKKAKDDLSDCLLQGMYVMRRPLVEAQTKARKAAAKVAKRAAKAAAKAAKAGGKATKPFTASATASVTATASAPVALA